MPGKLEIGCQMWSVDDIWKKDPAGALRRLRAMGYAGVQSMGFFSMDWDELARMLDGEGLRIVDMPFTTKLLAGGESKFLDFCGRFGVDFAFEPFADFKTAEEWRRHAAELAAIGERFAARGIRVGYHNHQHEIRNAVDGARPIDILFDAGVSFELDVGHLKVAGEDPVEWLGRLKGRVPSIHAKPAGDKSVGGANDANDWKAILAAAEAAGTKWAVVECEDRRDTFEDVAASMDFLATAR